jgi:hypothetical protein
MAFRMLAYTLHERVGYSIQVFSWLVLRDEGPDECKAAFGTR